MKKIYAIGAILIFIAELPATAQDLNFNTTSPIYPDGALSNNYTNVGSPGVDISVNVGSNGSQTFGLGTPKPVSTGLQIVADFPNTTDSKVITITFSEGVSNLSFAVYGVDKNATSQDKVIISADRYGVSVSPNITPSAFASVAGNTITGVADETSGSNPSPVQFADFVKTLTITFTNGPDAPSNPGAQGITVGHLTWTAPLPVTLLSFTAKPEGDRVQLGWATTSERDADRFVVERSADLREYVSVGEVTAKGTTDARQYYGLTDMNPLPGTNYYRLRQIDYNGTAYTFKTVSAVVEANDIVAAVYPNPADPARIHLRLWNADGAIIRLLTLTGQSIGTRLERWPGGVDLIPLCPLAAGVYLIEVQINRRKLVSKVVVR